MPTYLTNTAIVFNDGTSQTSAAVATSTAFGAVGTYAILMNAANFNYIGVGHIVFGSALRYDYISNGATINDGAGRTNEFANSWTQFGSSSYGAGGSALSGTWRKMSTGPTYREIYCGCGGGSYYQWAPALYVRIS